MDRVFADERVFLCEPAGGVQDMQLAELLVHLDSLDFLGPGFQALAAELNEFFADLERHAFELLKALGQRAEIVVCKRVVVELVFQFVVGFRLEIDVDEALIGRGHGPCQRNQSKACPC